MDEPEEIHRLVEMLKRLEAIDPKKKDQMVDHIIEVITDTKCWGGLGK